MIRGPRVRGTPWTKEERKSLAALWFDPSWTKGNMATTLGRTISAVEGQATHDKLGARPKAADMRRRADAAVPGLRNKDAPPPLRPAPIDAAAHAEALIARGIARETVEKWLGGAK